MRQSAPRSTNGLHRMRTTMWFDPPDKSERQRDDAKMKRIAAESQQQDDSQIFRWLDLADLFFRKDRKKKSKQEKQQSKEVA